MILIVYFLWTAPRKSLAKASGPPGDASAQKCSRKSPTKASQKRCNSTVRTSLALRTTSRGHSYEKSTHGNRFFLAVSSRAASKGHSYEESTRRATSRGCSHGEHQGSRRRTGGEQEENRGSTERNTRRTGKEQEENRRRTEREREEFCTNFLWTARAT